MNTNIHPSQKIISAARSTHPLSDLRNVVATLHDAVFETESDILNNRAVAELVWFASRAQTEALALLADRLGVDTYVLREAIDDPDESPELARRVNELVDGLVREI
ncbi:hypothetical protein MUN78_10090 [Leucobacter allii]|uniref:Uncharacterized protein n=1 Tax=Leucobacter allii TaxID=2932247 RepID=A0ABY4FHS8_9MICO|nr:hypothetical protein [Leucobacter allii]UOQ56053.1 hypothetical protein MUN78_10090 [Leucobacter allii]